VAYVGWVEGHPCWGKDELYRADPLCRWRGVGVYVETVGDGMPQLIARNAVDPAWSPDGRWLVVSGLDEREQVDVGKVAADGSLRERLTETPEREQAPVWIPEP